MRPWLPIVAACAGAPDVPPDVTAGCPPDVVNPVAEVNAIGRAAAPPARDDVMIPAFAACERPTVLVQGLLRERIEAWAGAPAQLRFGCVERAGTVVEAQVDRAPVAPSRSGVGTWSVLRVGPRVTVLDEVHGLARDEQTIYARYTTLRATALADLDGDGVLDAIDVRTDHTYGATYDDNVLAVALATGRRVELAHTRFEIAPALDAPPVLRLFGGGASFVVAYRCIVPGPVLATCPAVATARKTDAANEAASTLGALTTLPDRETLADLLAAIGVDRPDLLAAAAPTPVREHVVRSIHAWARPPDDRTDEEHEADDLRAALSYRDALRAAFGESACDDRRTRDDARLLAWAHRFTGAIALGARCHGPAGTFAVVEWTRAPPADSGEVSRRALVFADRDVHVLAEAAGYTDNEAGRPELDVYVARRGDHVLAMTYRRDDAGHDRVVGFIDGTRAGDALSVPYPHAQATGTLAGDLDLDDVTHLEAGGFVEVRPEPMVAHDHAVAIRELVERVTADSLAHDGDRVIAALVELDAPEALVRAVRRSMSP